MRYVFCFLLWGIVCGTYSRGESPGKESEKDKVAFTVFFERQTIREKDADAVEVWFSNETDKNITSATLNVSAPPFLTWHSGSKNGPEFGQSFPIGPVPAHATRSLKFYLTTGNDITVGEYSSLFTIKYQWIIDGAQRESFVAVEKSLRVNLLGTDSIAGIPLALAAFILPGLFFWLALRILGVPAEVELPLGDKLIYSVMLSVVFLGVAAWLKPYVNGTWIGYFDISTSLSVSKLVLLAVAGFISGLVAGLFGLLWRFVARRSEESKMITPNDSSTDLLDKVLQLNPDYQGAPVTVRLKDKSEFVGAHWAKTAEKLFLVASFEIDMDKLPDETKREIAKHTKDNKLIQEGARLFEVIKAIKSFNDLTVINQSSPIEQLMDKQRIDTKRDYMELRADEVSGVTRDYRKDFPLLTLP